MDIGWLRGVITLLSLLCFIGIVAWAYAPRHRAQLEDQGRLPFCDDLPKQD
jgi:cytochrome c oxidase cbb3-type subunit 4